jgi:PncC family amidohydrolase
MSEINRCFVKEFNEILQHKEIAIVCAESMTGGLLASTICSATGALSVLKGSVVAYDSAVKCKVLNVPLGLIEAHTAESAEVTEAMCKGIRQLYGDSELYVAVTGVVEKISGNTAREGQIYVAICYLGQIFQYDTVLSRPKSDHRNGYRVSAVRFIMDQILYIVTRPPVAGMVAPET